MMPMGRQLTIALLGHYEQCNKSNTLRDKTKGNKRFLEVFLPFFSKEDSRELTGKEGRDNGNNIHQRLLSQYSISPIH